MSLVTVETHSACLRYDGKLVHSPGPAAVKALPPELLGVVVRALVAGLVIERSQVRLPAGALPGSVGQLSLPSLQVG